MRGGGASFKPEEERWLLVRAFPFPTLAGDGGGGCVCDAGGGVVVLLGDLDAAGGVHDSALSADVLQNRGGAGLSPVACCCAL